MAISIPFARGIRYDYIDALAEANQIENLDEIYPGQVLKIPPMED